MESYAGDGATRSAVLLAAGRGSRLSELTDSTHKSLLDVGGQPALGRIISALSTAGMAEVVVVTGYRAEDLHAYVASEHPDLRVTFAHNSAWQSDTNILSTEVGVSALTNPENGYLIVETDVALDSAGWQTVASTSMGSDSIWYTKGVYSRELTGGCLATDGAGRVTELVYAPQYDEAFCGWGKLLGILYVAPPNVAADRQLRQRAIGVSTMQYYLQPYVDNGQDLPCVGVDLGDAVAMSFNDLAAYRAASMSLHESGD